MASRAGAEPIRPGGRGAEGSRARAPAPRPRGTGASARRSAEVGEGRAILELEQIARRRREREVAVGPDVGPEQAHREVDVGRPRSDPRHRDQRGPHVVVGQGLELGEVEPVEHRRRERARVAGLLATEPDRTELVVGEAQQGCRLDRAAERRAQPVERGLRARERDLLFEDQMHERRVGRVARPQRRRAVSLDRRAEPRVRLAELARRPSERSDRQWPHPVTSVWADMRGVQPPTMARMEEGEKTCA